MTESELEGILKKATRINFLPVNEPHASEGTIKIIFLNPHEFEGIACSIYFQKHFSKSVNSILLTQAGEEKMDVSFFVEEPTKILNIKNLTFDKDRLNYFLKKQPKGIKVNLLIQSHVHPGDMPEMAAIDPENLAGQPIQINSWSFIPLSS
jgi:hypothetical protein